MSDRPTSIAIELISDACFPVTLAAEGRRSSRSAPGNHVTSHTALDREGLPYIPARTVLGLLRTSWASLVPHHPDLREAGVRVLSLAGNEGSPSPLLRVGDARFAPAAAEWLRHATHRRDHALHTNDVRRALTVRRAQRRIDPETGTSTDADLREMDAIVAGTELHAPLFWLSDPKPTDLRVLALCCLASRHAGHLRTRGLGHVRLLIANSESEGVEDRKYRTVALALATPTVS